MKWSTKTELFHIGFQVDGISPINSSKYDLIPINTPNLIGSGEDMNSLNVYAVFLIWCIF